MDGLVQTLIDKPFDQDGHLLATHALDQDAVDFIMVKKGRYLDSANESFSQPPSLPPIT